MRVKDLYYERFGKLTAVYMVDDYISSKGYKYVRWLCFCDCGKCCVVDGKSLMRGITKSCGCLRRQKSSSEMIKRGHVIHNKSNTRLYGIWCGMKSRCYNKNEKAYSDYGARGITVCEEWLAFPRFYEWAMRSGYDPDAKEGQCTLDRINVNKGYCPENCRWVDRYVQSNNRTNNRYITWNNETKTLSQWADYFHINRNTLTRRLDYYKMTFEEAISIPVGINTHFIKYNNESLSIAEWARRFNIPYRTLLRRFNANWSIEDALHTPVGSKHKYTETQVASCQC